MTLSFVVFQLKAPFSSFGLSPGAQRLTETKPTKSAALGLVGAALGIDRSDTRAIAELTATRMAVLELRESTMMSDFHTVQAPLSTPEVARQVSRREQVEEIRRHQRQGKKYGNTIVSRRDYLQNGHWVVALQTSQAAVIAQALDAPRFPLYLGRKSCPLSVYTNPRVLETSTADGAVRQWLDATGTQITDASSLWWEDSMPCECQPLASHRRHDVRTHGMKNHFGSRNEYVGHFSPST